MSDECAHSLLVTAFCLPPGHQVRGSTPAALSLLCPFSLHSSHHSTAQDTTVFLTEQTAHQPPSCSPHIRDTSPLGRSAGSAPTAPSAGSTTCPVLTVTLPLPPAPYSSLHQEGFPLPTPTCPSGATYTASFLESFCDLHCAYCGTFTCSPLFQNTHSLRIPDRLASGRAQNKLGYSATVEERGQTACS